MKHRKKAKHYHEPGHLHELTFSCNLRRPLLTNGTWCEMLSRSIDEASKEDRVDLVAFVFMPEHVHLLVWPREGDDGIRRYRARLKRSSSGNIRQVISNPRLIEELTVQSASGSEEFRFWLPGAGYDRNIFSGAALGASVEYIHNNPVRRGLCVTAIDWKWSSARYYLLDPPRQQFPGLPYVHGLPPGALD